MTALVLSPGQSFKDINIGPEMVVVPAGEFIMGSPTNEPGRFGDEGPQHKVIIPRPFAVGKFAVTFNEWDVFATETGGYMPDDEDWGHGCLPVINVNWEDAQAYVKWLREKTGEEYRLLTEAEWEYAARAGTTEPYWCGKSISKDQANYNAEQTVAVDQFKPNPWGLYQMHGNVWEWCADHWHVDYNGAPADGSAWDDEAAASRVIRGGSWDNNPQLLRAAVRGWLHPGFRSSDVGFRCARALD